MKQLSIDTGVEEFCINGKGVLRFNPSDPNLYHRFFALGPRAGRPGPGTGRKKRRHARRGRPGGLCPAGGLRRPASRRCWGRFSGPENDFDKALGGVNLAGVAANGPPGGPRTCWKR